MYPSMEETNLWVALNLVQRATYRTIDTALKVEGLPPLRWYDVLWELERAEEGLRPFELEKRLIFEQSNLSHMLRRIVGEGLVKQKAHQDDRRGKVMIITKKGRGVRKQMWKIYGPLLHEYLSKVPDQYDTRNIASALKSIIA